MESTGRGIGAARDGGPRVVSLLPAATEICFALGVEPVGVSHECDYPPAARELPAVNRSRIDPDADSDGINTQVEDAIEEHGGIYEIDDETLRSVNPDVVVTQGICEVCAVDEILVRDAIERTGVDATLLTTDPHSLPEMLGAVERIGTALDRQRRATEYVAELKQRIDRVAEQIEPESPSAESPEQPRVAILDWPDPTMVAGHWIPGMVDRIGGEYGLAEPGDRSEVTDWETVLAYDPEVLIVAPCGFELDRARTEVEALRQRKGWAELTAVKRDNVWAMDGHNYVNRPGPRLVATLEQLAAIVRPDTDPDPAIARRVPANPIEP